MTFLFDIERTILSIEDSGSIKIWKAAKRFLCMEFDFKAFYLQRTSEECSGYRRALESVILNDP